MSIRELVRQKIVHEIRGLNSTIKVWNAGRPEPSENLKGHIDTVRAVVLSTDEGQTFIVSGSVDGTVKVWDRKTCTCMFTINAANASDGGVLDVALSSNNSYIATAGGDKLVRVFDVASKGDLVKTLTGHVGPVTAVTFLPRSLKVVSGSEDKTLKVFGVEAGAVEQQLKGHTDAITCVAASPDGHFVASGSMDSTIRVWGARDGKCAKTLKGHDGPVLSVLFTSTAQQIVSGSMDTTIKIFAVGSGHCLHTFKDHRASVHSLALCSGDVVVSGSSDASTRVWDLHTKECTALFKSHIDAVYAVAATNDAKQIIQGTAMNEEDWKVLIVDQTALKMLTQCFKTSELVESGVTVVEDIKKSRLEMPEFQALYIIEPTLENVNRIIEDFKPKPVDGQRFPPLYKTCNIFFLYDCPQALFSVLASSGIVNYVKTLKEIHALFTPDEHRVFTLDRPSGLFDTYSIYGSFNAEAIATQIATVCETLDVAPTVRFAAYDSPKCKTLAELVQKKVTKLANEKGNKRNKATLLVIGRGSDLQSPFAHELTYQAAAMDMLHIEEGKYTYKYKDGTGRTVEKGVPLDENDPLWTELRHIHIAKAMREVTTRFKEFSDTSKRAQGISSKGEDTTKALREMLNQLPQHRQQTQLYGVHIDINTSINKAFSQAVENCTAIEQNLLCGEDEEGHPIQDFIGEISAVVIDQSLSIDDKLRCIILCILANQGISKLELDSLLNNANAPEAQRVGINNLTQLGATVVTDKAGKKKSKRKSKRRQREVEYDISRWTPLIKDVMEDAVAGVLSPDEFPPVDGSVEVDARKARYAGDDDDDDDAPKSARKKKQGRGDWAKGGQRAGKQNADASSIGNGSDRNKLIVFVLGSICHSEMRCAYEVSRASGWDVYIGSQAIMTPTQFLRAVETLSDQPQAAAPEAEVVARGEGEGSLTIVKGTAVTATTVEI